MESGKWEAEMEKGEWQVEREKRKVVKIKMTREKRERLFKWQIRILLWKNMVIKHNKNVIHDKKHFIYSGLKIKIMVLFIDNIRAEHSV